MNSRRWAAALLGTSLACCSMQAWAVQEVCLINNASKAVKLVASGSPLDGNGTIELDASVGDQNRCWSVSASANAITINMWVSDGAGNWQQFYFDPSFTKDSPYNGGGSGVDGRGYSENMQFQNELLSEGGFFFNDDLAQWGPNSTICGYQVCMYNIGKGGDDVWRVIFEDL